VVQSIVGLTTFDCSQVCAAAQFCLPDAGKLNSELGEWAVAAGLAGAVPSAQGRGSEGGGGSGGGGCGCGGGGCGAPTAGNRFQRFKLEQEQRRLASEAAARAAAEAAAEAEAAADEAAEQEAARSGKATALLLETGAPKWPFGQSYGKDSDSAVGGDLVDSGGGDGGVGGGGALLALALPQALPQAAQQQQRLRPLRPISELGLAEEARRANGAAAKREEAKKRRAAELLVRGQGFEYKKTPNPRWARLMSFEPSQALLTEAHALAAVGMPKRRTQFAADAANAAAAAAETCVGRCSNSSGTSARGSNGGNGVGCAPPPPSSHGHGSSARPSARFPADAPPSPLSPLTLASPTSPLTQALRRRKATVDARLSDFLQAGKDWMVSAARIGYVFETR
jgi:hypothetical protein